MIDLNEYQVLADRRTKGQADRLKRCFDLMHIDENRQAVIMEYRDGSDEYLVLGDSVNRS